MPGVVNRIEKALSGADPSRVLDQRRLGYSVHSNRRGVDHDVGSFDRAAARLHGVPVPVEQHNVIDSLPRESAAKAPRDLQRSIRPTDSERNVRSAFLQHAKSRGPRGSSHSEHEHAFVFQRHTGKLL